MVSDTKVTVTNTQTMVADTKMTVTNTETIVTDTQTMVADIHRNILMGQKDDSGQIHSVGDLLSTISKTLTDYLDLGEVSDGEYHGARILTFSQCASW